MEIPIQLILYVLPSMIYLLVQREHSWNWSKITDNLGLRPGRRRDYLRALLGLMVVAILGWLAVRRLPPELFQLTGITTDFYSSLPPVVTTFMIILLREAFYIALGEEVFYRGLLGGWLNRRFGLVIGNTLQASLFIVPRLFLLSISQELWPLLVVLWLSGWFYGWLRYRSESILPGWLAHSLANGILAFTVVSS